MTDSAENLLDRLFTEVREVVLGERGQIDIDFDALATLVSNDLLQARFRLRFQREAQNKQKHALILTLLEGFGAKAAELAEQSSIRAQGIDNYVGRPGLGLAAGMIIALMHAASLSTILLLGCSVCGVAIGGFGSMRLRLRASRLRACGDRVQSLVKGLQNG